MLTTGSCSLFDYSHNETRSLAGGSIGGGTSMSVMHRAEVAVTPESEAVACLTKDYGATTAHPSHLGRVTV